MFSEGVHHAEDVISNVIKSDPLALPAEPLVSFAKGIQRS